MMVANWWGWARGRWERPDPTAIQGGILQGYGHKRVTYVFLRITDPAAARGWIATFEPTNATRYDARQLTRNIAFTARGLEKLGADKDLMGSFSDEFRAGMAERAARVLGDTGASHPDNWEPGPQSEGAHILVVLQAERGAELKAETERLLGEAAGVEPFLVQRGLTLPWAREHFGFSDGFAQPAVRKVRYTGGQLKGNGVPLRFGRWRRMALGEFVLGYYDEDNVRPEGPPGLLGRHGTYMVWRKLEQDVDGFRDSMLAAAGGDEDRARWLKARVVGRWDDGTPLAVSPDRPDKKLATDPKRRNNFRYADDPVGLRCPVGAHVRRTNPRDALGWGHKRSFRHRILRNGFAYEDRVDGGATRRGLVFVCFNANISRQFEVVQGAWSADGRIFGLGRDRDPLGGGQVAGGGKFVIGGSPPYFLAPPLRQFVTTCSGEYLFVPGIPALRVLAELGNSAHPADASSASARPPTSAAPSSQPACPPSASLSSRSGPEEPPNGPPLPPPPMAPPGPPACPSTRPRPL
jgi:Dyp-type peroxidase family